MDGVSWDYDNAVRARAPRILFVALVNDIGTDRLPAALGALGGECAVLSPPGFYCAATRAVGRWFPLPAHRRLWLGIPFLRPRLEAACRDWGAQLIVPLDNVSAQFLRVIATSKSVTPHLRMLLQSSLGAPGGYDAACTRSGLMKLAGELGVHLPQVCVSADATTLLDHAKEWGFPVVLKSENTCGGHGVSIAETPDDLRAQLAGLFLGSPLTRLKRSLKRRFWTMLGLRETAGTGAPPVLQSFMPGIPAMRTVSTWQGQVLDGASFAAEAVSGRTGPSTMVRYVDNAEMAETARRLVQALGCSGFISFDFMLDETTGRAALIEANPRPIGTTYLGRMFGHDSCAPLLACLSGARPSKVQPEVATPRVVAMFPKEIERDPQNLRRLHADGIYHTVPSDDPAVMAMYLRRLASIHPGEMPAILEAVGAVGLGTRATRSWGQWLRMPRGFMEAFARSP